MDLNKLQSPGELNAVSEFFDNVGDAAGKSNTGLLDSTAAEYLLREPRVPTIVQEALSVFDERYHAGVLDAVRQGADNYQQRHGRAPSALDLTTSLSRAIVDMAPMNSLRIPGVLDSATNLHHDQISLQPARAIQSILALFDEMHPVAAYLPTDTNSNEARLLVTGHQAQSDFGDYSSGDSLNGVDSGNAYFEGERYLSLGNAGGASFNVTVTARNGLQAGPTNRAMKLLRGRTIVYVNGLPVAREAEIQGGTGPNAIAGQVTLAGTAHGIAGSANSDTGDVTFTFSPALPAGNEVCIAAYVDYERDEEAPTVGIFTQVYKLFAHASRGLTTLSIDAQTQYSQEVGMDARGQLQMALRSQFASERFYRCNVKALAIARGFQATWDYDFTSQIAQKDYYQMWLNLAPLLGLESQKMAERTIDHGIDTLFMTGNLAALCRGLPSVIWEPSGIIYRPAPYRMGRLFGMYDVYYVPRGLTESADFKSSQILAMGRGSNVARNMLVMGDAVPGMVVPIATGKNMNANDGFYTRAFSEVNPHYQSSLGATLINVINIR